MIWTLAVDEAVLGRFLKATDATPPELDIANRIEVMEAQERRHPQPFGSMALRYWGPWEAGDFPPPRLVNRLPDFHPDFYHDGLFLASARFRDAADLPPEVAQYTPVDDADTPEPARAQRYAVFWPYAVCDLLDAEASEFVTIPDPLDPSRQTPVGLRRLAWRKDAAPDAPVFRIPQDPRFFATEAFAARLTAAGLTGVAFLDPGTGAERRA
jgi:hypothetical protein